MAEKLYLGNTLVIDLTTKVDKASSNAFTSTGSLELLLSNLKLTGGTVGHYITIGSDGKTLTGKSIPSANSTTAGVVKLATTTGQASDATITQKIITDELAKKVDSSTLTTTLSTYATIANLADAVVGKLTVVKLASLPATGEEGKIYLIPKTGSTIDVHNEYLWMEGKFELIGSTSVDLTDYYTKTQTDSTITTAKNAAITVAATDATTKANNAKIEAISTASTDAQTKADAAKSSAISAASTDATTKANNAKSTAIADAKSYADSTFFKIMEITQVAYTALSTKDPKTLYIING